MHCAVQTNAILPHCTDGTYGRPVEWDSALDVLLQKLAWSRLSNYWQRQAKVTHLARDLGQISDRQQQCDRVNHSVPLQPATQGIRMSFGRNNRAGPGPSSLIRAYKLRYVLLHVRA